MRRQSLFVRAFLALAVFWMAGDVVARATPHDAHGSTTSIHHDAAALSAQHVFLGHVASPKRAPAPDWSGRLGVPSRAFLLGDARFRAPSAFASHGVRDGAEHTVTYDATAPPSA